MMALRRVALAGALVLALATQGGAFAPVARGVQRAAPLRCEGAPKDPKAEVRAKIQLTGDASGGYFRACFRNEAKFNRFLKGYLTEQGEGNSEIVVEGRQRSVDAFLRFCKKDAIGLSQRIEVASVEFEDATGEFSDFDVNSLEGVKSA